MIQVAVINESTVVSDQELAACIAALLDQVQTDFFPYWGIECQLVGFQKANIASIPADMWQLVILDDSDQAEALGYHELTASGRPLGKVFAKSDIDAGTSWTVTASHELLEMLADPWINLAAERDEADGTASFYAYEVCDAVEADALGYKIGDVLVSDFVTPAWFQPAMPGPYSLKENVKNPFELAAGGYISVLRDFSSGWEQVTARHIVQRGAETFVEFSAGGPKAPEGSRRDRRTIIHSAWRKSTPHGLNLP
jgi:hypothetical protein